jgi:hypothetical protein
MIEAEIANDAGVQQDKNMHCNQKQQHTNE